MMNANLFKKFDIVQSEDGKSVYLDFDIESHLARLTIWGRGEGMGACDMEILEVASEKQLLWEHHDFRNSTEFYAMLNGFMRNLDDLTNQKRASHEGGTVSPPFELHLEDKNIGLEGVLEPLLVTVG
jgi:hypothetical protein